MKNGQTRKVHYKSVKSTPSINKRVKNTTSALSYEKIDCWKKK